MANRAGQRAYCGVLNLDKPPGVTSRDVVNRVVRAMPTRGVKVGHAGTLDPLATGVLVVCVGAATRLIESIQKMPKTYRAVVLLGATSDTLDADGAVTPVADPPVPDEPRVREALASQVGEISQRPPEFSALKVGGQRAYDLARAGREVELAARPVTVHRIDLIRYGWPRLEIEVECGAGTYIRSIARDVGELLGCGGLIEVLRRTRIGPFTEAEAIDPQQLDPETLPTRLRPAVQAVAGLPQLRLSPDQVAAVSRGQALRADRLGPEPAPAGEVALLDPSGQLVAIAEADPRAGRIFPRRVLVGGGAG